MMKTLHTLLPSALLLGGICPAFAVPSPALQIVPGQRIGHTLLGHDGAYTLARLPKPTRSDAGMSQRYYVWLLPSAHGTQNTLFIHAVSNGALSVKPLSGMTLDTIRVTSPTFATASGLHAGSTLAQIRRRYPHLQPANDAHTLYDARQQGIAFEFAHSPTPNSRAIAVSVHTPGEAATMTAYQVNETLKTP